MKKISRKALDQKRPVSKPARTGPIPPYGPGAPSSRGLLAVLILIVVAVTLFVHWPVLHVQAKSFDDEEAIIQNGLVQNPSWNSVGRFFSEVTLSSVVRGYYRPLTLTSLMVDWAMGGRPDDFYVFHRTSLILHVGSTILIILLLYQLFGRPIVAALVGLLFGVHPLTVEPIAWVMERKTLLAAFFAFACLNAYVRYTALAGGSPFLGPGADATPRSLFGPGRAKGRPLTKPGWYAAAVILYLLSLLAKPTSTPLPIIMLLMDVWPLKRIGRWDPASTEPGTVSWLRLILEKVPFIILSMVFAGLCVLCEEKVNPLSLPAKLSPLHLPLRLCWLAVFYPCKILLPIHLSSVYALPDPLALSNGLVLLAVAGVVLLTVALVITRRWTPALWTGAIIFYIGLAPTMGFVGYSWVVASDKYVYLPVVGLLLILGWFLERIWSRGVETGYSLHRAGLVATVVVVAALLATGTRRYLSHWQTTIGLYDYFVSLAPDASPVLYNNRGIVYGAKGAYDQAIQDYSKAIQLKPNYVQAYYNRGNAYGAKGAYDQAIQDFSKAIQLNPNLAEVYYNRGNACNAKGAYDQAIQDYSKAIQLNPNYVRAYYNRAVSLYQAKRYDQAWADVRTFRRLGGIPKPDFIKKLVEATGRTE